MLLKGQRLVLSSSVWALSVLAAMVLFHSLNFEYFFVLCLIGFLVLLGLGGPFTTRPRWRRRADLALVAATIVFIILIIQKAVYYIR